MKFSIVTPVYNGERFLRACLESVLFQEGDFEIEHVVMDGGSCDATVSILEQFQEDLTRGLLSSRASKYRFEWRSEPDGGMYDAINSGFQKTTGDVMAWINADDIYQAGAFRLVSRAFREFPETEWLKGITDYLDEDSRRTELGKGYLYFRPWIVEGVYGRETYFIQQDSVFWRRSLWMKAGPLRSDLKLASDFELWSRFAEHADLFVVNRAVSSFRHVEGQLSGNVKKYSSECNRAVPRKNSNQMLTVFFKIYRRLPKVLGNFLYRIFFPAHRMPWIEENSKTSTLIRQTSKVPLLPNNKIIRSTP